MANEIFTEQNYYTNIQEYLAEFTSQFKPCLMGKYAVHVHCGHDITFPENATVSGSRHHQGISHAAQRDSTRFTTQLIHPLSLSL